MIFISRSPIYSHFGETVSGSTTIRAYNLTRQFIATNEKKIDDNQVCYYPTFVSSRWLAVRLGRGCSKTTLKIWFSKKNTPNFGIGLIKYNSIF